MEIFTSTETMVNEATVKLSKVISHLDQINVSSVVTVVNQGLTSLHGV